MEMAFSFKSQVRMLTMTFNTLLQKEQVLPNTDHSMLEASSLSLEAKVNFPFKSSNVLILHIQSLLIFVCKDWRICFNDSMPLND